MQVSRRKWLGGLAAGMTAGLPGGMPSSAFAPPAPFGIRYVLSSALYGNLPLAQVLPEVAKSGSIGLDIWGKRHATHREEVDAMGINAFANMLTAHKVQLHVSTRYPLGCFGLQPEMPILKQLGGKILVCGNTGGKEPEGKEAKAGVKTFLEKMEPHADKAGELGLVIALENHARQLIHHPDSIRAFAELNQHPALGLSFAPHHLHQHIEQIPGLIRDLGAANLPFIYFQEYGIGSKKTVAKEIELQQLPGRGTLDYVPIIRALKEVQFDGVAEIFMHPTPRGIPMLDSAAAITKEINRSRAYLSDCLAKVNAA